MGSLEISQVILGVGNPSSRSGAGSPNGTVGGIVGDLFQSTNGLLYRCTVAHATAATWVVASGVLTVGASVTAAGVTSIVKNVDTPVTWWSAATWDTGGFWSGGAPSRLTAVSAGYYYVVAQYASAHAVGNSQVVIKRNGVVMADQAHNEAWYINCAALVYMTAGQYVECMVRQESAANQDMINASSFFQIHRLA